MGSLIKESNIKKVTELSVSKSFKQELEKEVLLLISRAEKRARLNCRKTLFACDV